MITLWKHIVVQLFNKLCNNSDLITCLHSLLPP